MTDAIKQLPIGKTSFTDIRYENYLYVDKTELLYNLIVKRGSPYLLTRPRGFGKSLLVDTLKSILTGRWDLCKGLWIYESDYDWEANPVIQLSLASLNTSKVETVEDDLMRKIQIIATDEEITLQGATPVEAFAALFTALHEKYDQKVAVLIDDYDAPILDTIGNGRLADDIRQALTPFFGVLRDRQEIRGFTFICGAARFTLETFSRAFKGYHDLTFDPDYATICGFTFHELDSSFRQHMEKMLPVRIEKGTLPPGSTLTDLTGLILDRFDGYSWDGETRVLNPWSILKTFESDRLDDYWFHTGGLSDFLVDLFQAGLADPDSPRDKKSITEKQNVIDLGKGLKPVPVLFQAGYLTVEQVDKSSGTAKYFLRFPNLEVRAGLIPILLSLDPVDKP
jgi:hypothetical protein